MPKALSEEAVARWMHGENHAYIRDTLGECCRTWDAEDPNARAGEEVRNVYRNMARAVLALVREKVREGVEAAAFEVINGKPTMDFDAIVARVMKGAPRG